MKVFIKNSSIKGYHIYKVQPHGEIELEVKVDQNNAYDPDAMAVWMPELEAVPERLRYTECKPAKNGKPCQKVNEIAGKMVGRVPANLGKVFKSLKLQLNSIKW